MCGLSRDGPALVVDRQLRVLVGFVDDLAKVVCRVHALLLPEVERRANHGNFWLFSHNLVSPVCDPLRHLLDERAILWIRVLRRHVELHANLLVPEEDRIEPLLADPTVFALKPLLLVQQVRQSKYSRIIQSGSLHLKLLSLAVEMLILLHEDVLNACMIKIV